MRKNSWIILSVSLAVFALVSFMEKKEDNEVARGEEMHHGEFRHPAAAREAEFHRGFNAGAATGAGGVAAPVVVPTQTQVVPTTTTQQNSNGINQNR
jgi:hypothetical protein